MLELLFKGLFQWIYELFLELVEYVSNALLDVLSMDLSYFMRTVPVAADIMSILRAVGWALLLGNLVFQAARSMLSGVGFEGEDPRILFTRTFVFSFLLIVSNEICSLGLNLTQRVIDLLQVPSSVTVQMPTETIFNTGAAWLLVIIIGVVVGWQYIKLCIEVGERYVVLASLTILAPLAFGVGGSQSTADIFKGWARMYGSMCFMMVSSVIFLKMLISALGYVPAGLDAIPWAILIVAIARVARKVDEIITRIGLNPAITGSGLGRNLPGMLAYTVVRGMTSTISHTVGRSMGGGATQPSGGGPGGGSGGGPGSGTGGAVHWNRGATGRGRPGASGGYGPYAPNKDHQAQTEQQGGQTQAGTGPAGAPGAPSWAGAGTVPPPAPQQSPGHQGRDRSSQEPGLTGHSGIKDPSAPAAAQTGQTPSQGGAGTFQGADARIGSAPPQPGQSGERTQTGAPRPTVAGASGQDGVNHPGAPTQGQAGTVPPSSTTVPIGHDAATSPGGRQPGGTRRSSVHFGTTRPTYTSYSGGSRAAGAPGAPRNDGTRIQTAPGAQDARGPQRQPIPQEFQGSVTAPPGQAGTDGKAAAGTAPRGSTRYSDFSQGTRAPGGESFNRTPAPGGGGVRTSFSEAAAHQHSTVDVQSSESGRPSRPGIPRMDSARVTPETPTGDGRNDAVPPQTPYQMGGSLPRGGQEMTRPPHPGPPTGGATQPTTPPAQPQGGGPSSGTSPRGTQEAHSGPRPPSPDGYGLPRGGQERPSRPAGPSTLTQSLPRGGQEPPPRAPAPADKASGLPRAAQEPASHPQRPPIGGRGDAPMSAPKGPVPQPRASGGSSAAARDGQEHPQPQAPPIVGASPPRGRQERPSRTETATHGAGAPPMGAQQERPEPQPRPGDRAPQPQPGYKRSGGGGGKKKDRRTGRKKK